MNELNELKTLWGKFLGKIPSNQQFDFWAMSHSLEIIRHGILKTTQKNLSVGGTMSDDHKVRFASKVMLTLTGRRKEHAENRRKLQEEFSATAVQVVTAPTGDSSQEAGLCAS